MEWSGLEFFGWIFKWFKLLTVMTVSERWCGLMQKFIELVVRVLAIWDLISH